MTEVAVVDYGAGNLVSIQHALERAGATVRQASRAADLVGADAIVVPGVGASGPAMARLRRQGLDRAITDAVQDGTWYFGVCLGLQLLFERSEEDGAEMLGLLAGSVERVPDAPRLPHIGWNSLERVRDHPLLEGVADGAPAYFVHSFVGVPEDRSTVVAETEHGGRFPSVVAAGRIMGIQCHPERSGADGLRILANLVRLASPAGVAAAAT
ncbi:MAG: imidazole glycerol phosphate synthase subunit HisH [Chloroflexota bacterium]|nr:imidazole glycerol phosphate synthase subunit HisH [Chloroflexota bacterium]